MLENIWNLQGILIFNGKEHTDHRSIEEWWFFSNLLQHSDICDMSIFEACTSNKLVSIILLLCVGHILDGKPMVEWLLGKLESSWFPFRVKRKSSFGLFSPEHQSLNKNEKYRLTCFTIICLERWTAFLCYFTK